MIRRFFLLCLALNLILPGGPAAAQRAAPLSRRVLDERVATIGHRLAVANLAWCRDTQWLPGITLGVEAAGEFALVGATCD